MAPPDGGEQQEQPDMAGQPPAEEQMMEGQIDPAQAAQMQELTPEQQQQLQMQMQQQMQFEQNIDPALLQQMQLQNADPALIQQQLQMQQQMQEAQLAEQ